MNEQKVMITTRNLWASYENELVLEDINLDIFENDFLGLIGPNGGGKTTLIKVLLGLLKPIRGEVEILGEPVSSGRRHIGYVPQLVEFDRDFPISVWDVTLMGRLGRRGLFHRYTQDDHQAVSESLERVGMLAYRDRPISELSGGQRQRVYIARALAKHPKILILDEPTASIDPENVTGIFELLKALNQEATILMISHNMSAISSYTKTVGCLNRKLHYHGEKKITPEMLDAAYQCPVDLIAHGVPHRVFSHHSHSEVEHD
jgi:zinc transport system ATP-binding protein